MRFRFAPLALVAALVGHTRPLPAQGASPQVTPGISVLVRDSLHLIRGKRVGLITNHTGRDAAGTSSIDLLAKAPGVRLTALFGPEHGLRGIAQAGEHVASSVDSATGVPIYSLYGSTQVPTPEMLSQVDVLVYDIQDVGVRTYTYAWTMALSAAAAGKAGIPFIVCDRPAMLTGGMAEGNVLDTAYRSFVGQFPVAMRYALTPGELLRHLVRTGQVNATVAVVPMQGWRRDMWYDETGLPWIAPSPNIRTLDAALLYAGTVLVEGTNLSEGRGTEAPFQLIGAPWLTDVRGIIRDLASRSLRGVAFDSVSRTIAAGQKFGGQTIPMLRVTVTDRTRLDPFAVALHVLQVIHQRHPAELTWRTDFLAKLAGDAALQRVLEGDMTGVFQYSIAGQARAQRFTMDAFRDWLYRGTRPAGPR